MRFLVGETLQSLVCFRSISLGLILGEIGLTMTHHLACTMQGVGEKIAERDIPKIFLLNGSHDRETSAGKSSAGPMTACDVVLAVCDALNRRHAKVVPPAQLWLTRLPWHPLSSCIPCGDNRLLRMQPD